MIRSRSSARLRSAIRARSASGALRASANFGRMPARIASSCCFCAPVSASSRSRRSRSWAGAPPGCWACAAGSVADTAAASVPRGAPPSAGPVGGSWKPGGRNRSAALGTLSADSRVSVTMRTLAVMPGISERSGLCADTTTV